MLLTLSLPLPVSVNSMFFNRRSGVGRGRVKSKQYRNWIKQADAMYSLQGLGRMAPIRGPYTIKIVLPPVRSDTDNLAKCVVDWLVSRKLTDDDKYLRELTVKIDGNQGTLAWITVRSL